MSSFTFSTQLLTLNYLKGSDKSMSFEGSTLAPEQRAIFGFTCCLTIELILVNDEFSVPWVKAQLCQLRDCLSLLYPPIRLTLCPGHFSWNGKGET